MAKDIAINTLILCILILAQVFIFNHIILFNVAVGFVFIYSILTLPMKLNSSIVLTIAFLAGLAVDILSDTPGVNSLACTLMAGCRKRVMFAYISRDDRTKDIQPSIRTMGFATYSKYLLTLSALYCVFVFMIEYANFVAPVQLLIMIISSSLLTFILLMAIDSFVAAISTKK